MQNTQNTPCMVEKSWFYFFLFFFAAALVWTIFGDGVTRLIAITISFGTVVYSGVKLEDACNKIAAH